MTNKTMLSACIGLAVSASVALATEPPAVTPEEATALPLELHREQVERIEPFEFEREGKSVRFDRRLRLLGAGFYGTSVGPFVHFGERPAEAVVLRSAEEIVVYVPEEVRGPTRVKVTLPDGRRLERDVEL